MSVKEYLQSIRGAEREIRILKEKRQHYLDMATSMSGMSESTIRNTNKRSRVEIAAVNLVELSDEISEQAELLQRRVKGAEWLISKLDKPRYRQVLTLRYLAGKSWADVAREMGYQETHNAHTIHGWALAEAQKIFEKGLVLD